MAESSDQSRVKSILGEASELPTAERAAFLDQACGDDAALRREVESLLAHLDATVEASGGSSGSPRGSGTRGGVTPKRIGAYTVIGKLGEGGMGVVYKATQDFPRRTVALKVIKPHMASPRILERFRFETQVLAKLTHPGIAQIYEAGTTQTPEGEQPYFAMELVRGRPLIEYARLRNLTMRERLALVQRIAEAVHHAHTRGVVHRDLKPGNILVTEDGTPKILDFGVARSVGGEVGVTSQRTEVGQLVGTLPYMSPEQVAGDPDELDARSDVYSLGIVMYEMLSGGLPYELEKKVLQEAMRVIQEVEPTRLSQISKVYRGDVETIVGKALSKDRTRRYQSASEFASDIFRFLNDEPITARPPSAMYQVRKFAKRHRVIAGGVGVAAVGLAGGLGVSLWQLGATREAKDLLAESNSDLETALSQVTTERDRAEAVIEQLNQLTQVLLDYEAASRRLIGSISSRRVLAENARDVLSELRRITAGTPWVRGKLAHAYTRLGTLSWLDAGTINAAAEDFESAVELHRQELQDRPGDPEHTEGLALSLSSLASLSTLQGGTQPAMAMVLEAETLASGDPGLSPTAFAQVLRTKGAVLREQGRDDEALGTLQQAADLIQTDISLDARDLHALILADLAEIHSRATRGQEALTLIEEALTTRRELMADHPSDGIIHRRMITLLNISAEQRERAGDRERGLALHQELFGLAERLVRLDAADEFARASMRKSMHALSRAYQRAGEYDAAVRSAEAFLLASRTASETHPTDPTLQHDVAHAHELRGDLLRAGARQLEAPGDSIEQIESAIGDYQESIAGLRWMLAGAPGRAEWRRDEARVALKIAFATSSLGGFVGEEEQEATLGRTIEAYEAASGLYLTLIAEDLADEPTLNRGARCIRSLGYLYLEAGRPAEAYERFQRADEIHPLRQAHAAFNKARAAADLGRLEEAREHHAQALEWSREGRSRYRDTERREAELAEIEAFTVSE